MGNPRRHAHFDCIIEPQELNWTISSEGRRRVVRRRSGHGAEFQATSSLHLVFYADGIVVGFTFSSPWRVYSAPAEGEIGAD